MANDLLGQYRSTDFLRIGSNKSHKWRDGFHTGKVQSEQSQLVKIKTLPVGDYNWRVRVWNKSDEPSSWSDKGRFIITNVKASFGESRWIGAITKADAHTPEGRIFHGSEMKKKR